MLEPRSITTTGERIGQYELLERLSGGFFGPRFRARSAGGATRALRVIETKAPERLASAAAAIRGVGHASLLSPVELLRPARGLVVVTEHIPGETLRVLIERAVAAGESIPEAIALRAALDLLEGLSALELGDSAKGARPHLYGGLTLDSIHVGRDGRTRLLDPGIAAAAAREPAFANDPVRAAYTAPEHFLDGKAPFDVRSDVFALGVVLWELLACRSLFGDPSYASVVARVKNERVARAQRERFLRGEPVSAGLSGVVERALQRHAERRFQSYAELCEALRRVGKVAEHEEVARFVEGGMRSLDLGNEPSAKPNARTSAPRLAPLPPSPPSGTPGSGALTPSDVVAQQPLPPLLTPLGLVAMIPNKAPSTAPRVLPVEHLERRPVRNDLRLLVGFAVVLILGALVLWRARGSELFGHHPADTLEASRASEGSETKAAASGNAKQGATRAANEHVEPASAEARAAEPALVPATGNAAAAADAPGAPPPEANGAAAAAAPVQPAPAPSTGEAPIERPRREAAPRPRRRAAEPSRPSTYEYIPDTI